MLEEQSCCCCFVARSKQRCRCVAFKPTGGANVAHHGKPRRNKTVCVALIPPHQGMQMRNFSFFIFFFSFLFSSLHAATDQHFTQQVRVVCSFNLPERLALKSFPLVIHPSTPPPPPSPTHPSPRLRPLFPRLLLSPSTSHLETLSTFFCGDLSEGASVHSKLHNCVVRRPDLSTPGFHRNAAVQDERKLGARDLVLCV